MSIFTANDIVGCGDYNIQTIRACKPYRMYWCASYFSEPAGLKVYQTLWHRRNRSRLFCNRRDYRTKYFTRIPSDILKSATYEILYKPNVSVRIIIKEYLNASNFFLNESQTKYLNALLDNAAKRLRYSNA